MIFDEKKINSLPVNNGFRLRGMDVTRLETFIDAAFAFAVTMLVISVGNIPNNYGEFILALKGVPSFAASFASITLFWVGHRKWSRFYGLEDMGTILISLSLIFVMLVYVYPLKLLFSSLFTWISNGWFPSEFILHFQFELINLFIIYGIGFAVMSALMAVLYLRAKSARKLLNLNTLEIGITNLEIASWMTLSITGLISALFAWIMPSKIAVFAGFVYTTLPLSMPLVSIHFHKKIEK
jgi:uncharacterized membrane protein